jgi:hypothetical protein
VTALRIDLPAEALEAIVAAATERVRDEAGSRRRFVSKGVLAEHYGVSERTIRTWREKGLPGCRVGREVMYEVAAVDRWIESHG